MFTSERKEEKRERAERERELSLLMCARMAPYNNYKGQFLCPIGLRQLPYLEKSVLDVPETSHESLSTPNLVPIRKFPKFWD
jgi:hypothetical protein